MGIRCALILSLFLFGVPFGHGQTFVHIPDDLPAVGACYGSSFFVGHPTTYVARVPGAFLGPSNRGVRDIAFGPCSAGPITA
ncbi:MAG TPA: hypothetical protein PKA37_03290, partial [Planctomycetota bacterium]|nr:hypothetical protein [Planctomycetota bacterium]